MTTSKNYEMTSISTEERARCFMSYGACATEPPEVSIEVEVETYKGYYTRFEVIRDIYAFQIMKAARFYIDDLVFAYNSPKHEYRPCSELEADIYDELASLSEETLCMLATVIKTNTN